MEVKLEQNSNNSIIVFITKNNETERFRSNEATNIIRVYSEMKEKSMKTNSKEKYIKENTEKERKMGKKLENVFDLFG